MPQEVDGEILTRCPLRPSLDNRASFQRFLALYSWYKRGQLPDAGSYLDQAAACAQLVEIFDGATAEADKIKERMEKSRANNKPQRV